MRNEKLNLYFLLQLPDLNNLDEKVSTLNFTFFIKKLYFLFNIWKNFGYLSSCFRVLDYRRRAYRRVCNSSRVIKYICVSSLVGGSKDRKQVTLHKLFGARALVFVDI